MLIEAVKARETSRGGKKTHSEHIGERGWTGLGGRAAMLLKGKGSVFICPASPL